MCFFFNEKTIFLCRKRKIISRQKNIVIFYFKWFITFYDTKILAIYIFTGNKIISNFIFISNNVKIVSNNNEVKSDFGYFDVQNNLLLLYGNVNIFSKTNTSSGEFYIYNLLDKSVVSFTENTILPKHQQDNIYKILEKISAELNAQQKLYIVNFVKNNKIYNNINALHNYGVNYNIDRQKRTKIEVMY